MAAPKKKLGLLPKLIIAIALGLIIGTIARSANLPIIIRIGATFNSIFGNFLGFCIPLIIIGFVAPGIADLGSGAGKTLAITAGIAYLSTLISGTFAYLVDSAIFPSFLKIGSIVMDNAQNAEDTMLAGLFTVEMPPLMGVITALIISFIMGIGIAVTKAENLRNNCQEVQGLVEGGVANVRIPLLPVHIYGIFANMTYAGTVAEIMSVFAKVFAIIICMHLIIIVFQYAVAGSFAKKNPFGMIKNMIPAYMTAIGTQSSAATIPVTL
ncbi:MAG: cation:dicarboxylase symporter family transporter, partial [Oscillospiraceae bacterium]|nr:cation:dicarboxylase symporter family transporter [Oscillospiraceae bacterium]